MQGLNTTDAGGSRAGTDQVGTGLEKDLSITSQFKAVALAGEGERKSLDLPDDRRNRVERRRTRNPVFEARARRVGMALDRRRRQGWLMAVLLRSKRGIKSLLGAHRARDSAAQHQA